MIKVVGFKRSTGIFTDANTGEGRPYDNVTVYFIQKKNSDPLLHGFACLEYKVKYECAEAVLGLPEKDWDKLINSVVSIETTTGRFPKLEEVTILEK